MGFKPQQSIPKIPLFYKCAEAVNSIMLFEETVDWASSCFLRCNRYPVDMRREAGLLLYLGHGGTSEMMMGGQKVVARWEETTFVTF